MSVGACLCKDKDNCYADAPAVVMIKLTVLMRQTCLTATPPPRLPQQMHRLLLLLLLLRELTSLIALCILLASRRRTTCLPDTRDMIL